MLRIRGKTNDEQIERERRLSRKENIEKLPDIICGRCVFIRIYVAQHHSIADSVKYILYADNRGKKMEPFYIK